MIYAADSFFGGEQNHGNKCCFCLHFYCNFVEGELLAGTISGSSMYSSRFAPGNALDGDWNTHFATKSVNYPLLQVEFDKLTVVTKVDVRTRSDCCIDRFHTVTVSVGNDGPMVTGQLSTNPVCGHYVGPASVQGEVSLQ